MGLPVEWPSVHSGDVITVDLSHTGLGPANSSVLLYMREMCIKLYTFFEKEVEQVKMICGCPGVGKSVEVYSYVMWLAVTKRKRVIYMHGDEVGGISIVFKYESILSKVKTSQISLTRTAVLLSFLVSLLDGGTVDVRGQSCMARLGHRVRSPEHSGKKFADVFLRH